MTNATRFHLCEAPTVVRLIETKQNGGYPGPGEENGASLSNGQTEFWRLHTMVQTNLTLLNLTLKNGECGQFHTLFKTPLRYLTKLCQVLYISMNLTPLGMQSSKQ